MIPEAPPRARSKTPKLQSLWEAVNGAPEGLSTVQTWCDGPETETTDVSKPQESDLTRSTKTQYRQITPMSVPPSSRTVTGGQTAARAITIQHRRRSLCKPLLLRPAYPDVGVDVLYGKIYGMSTPPAEIQAVEEDRPKSVDDMLNQREREMDRRLLEWRDAYLVRARGDQPPAEQASSGSTGIKLENAKTGSGNNSSGNPEAPIQMAEGGLKQSAEGKQVVQKSREGGGQQVTATTKRILSDTSIRSIISPKRVCQATECDKISDSVPHMASGLFTEPDQIPQNVASQYDTKCNDNTDMREYFMATEATPPLLTTEVMESDQPMTTIVHRIAPPSWAEDRIKFSHDRGSKAAETEINDWITVKRAEMALKELCQEHENWKKSAEVINTTISKHISDLRQLHSAQAAIRVVRRSPLLTALTEVNLKILNELQKGIPEVTLGSLVVKGIPQAIPESPGKDSGGSEYTQYSDSSGGGENREEPSQSNAADKFRFEILEDDEGETWVELCKPPRLGGKS